MHRARNMRLTPVLLLLCLTLLPALGQAAGKTVYGLNEYAHLGDLDLEVAAKLDTGAKTASLSARDIKRFKRNGESWGRVHWVAIRPEFQGRGLAKPLISASLRIIEQLGHDKVYLSTATPRLPAINLYLSQGFLPERHSEEDIVAWEEVARWIKLP